MALRHVITVLCIVYLVPLVLTVLDDTVKYSLSWPGKEFDLKDFAGEEYNEPETLKIKTQNNEEYECMIPTYLKEKSDEEEYNEATPPSKLLSPLLKKNTCTYRLGLYWQYEICHGKHIRQFHEDKIAGGGTKLQEYFLGYFKDAVDENGVLEGLKPDPKTSDEIPTRKFDGVTTPYYELEMTSGTPCDLMGGTKRKTRVLYICDPSSANGMISVVETSSCEYEVVVATPLLCANPFYRVKSDDVNEIFCSPLGDTPAKPHALVMEEKKDRVQPSRERREVVVDRADEIRADAVKDDYRRLENTQISSQTDKMVLRQFLKGEFCLTGNSGWWSYEFCYGKYVKQYHIDKVSGRTVIMVGIWDEDAHLKWAKTRTARHVKGVLNDNKGEVENQVNMVEHFYHKGDFCEAANKPREVVVRLKCKQSGSKHSVAIYLREPSTCSYILGVESPIICDLLETADQNGLFHGDV